MFATEFLWKRARKDTLVAEPEEPSVPGSARDVVAEARERGAIPHVIDSSQLVTKRQVLDAIAAELSFPEWSGRNLDALYDCLTDLSWLPEGEHVLVWRGYQALAERDPKAYRGIAAVLGEAEDCDFCDRGFSAVRTRD